MASESSTKPIKEISTPAQSKKPTPKLKFKGHEERIWDFVFLHDNIHIVSSSEDGIMRKWNCKTGFAVGKPWKGEGGDIYALSLSPNGKMIACGRVDGSVQRWSTNGEMIKGVWTGHSKAVRSLSWSPSGSHIASGSDDGTILIRNAESGKVKVGPIKTEQEGVESLAYSPSGDRLASGGFNTICIWNAKTGEPVVTPTKDLGNTVTSLVWSSDSSKLYSAAGSTAHVFDSKSGEQFYHFNMKHSSFLWSIALSPKQNVLACVGNNGVAQLWDIESYQPLGQPLCEDDEFTFRCVSFSQDGRYVACGGDDKKLTLWMVQDIIPQLPAPTLLQRSDRQSTQQETRPNSPLSSCLDADATGGGGFIEEAYDDPYNNFFQSSRQSLPSPSPPLSPGFHFPSLFLARRFLNVISRHRPPPDEFIPKESSKRSFFSRRARSNSSLELATMTPNQPVPGTKVKQSQGEQGDDVDDCGSAHDSLSTRHDKGKQRDDPPDNAQNPPSYNYNRTLPTYMYSKDSRGLWERLMQARGNNLTFGFLHSSTPSANAPRRRIPLNPWHWNYSLFPAGHFGLAVDIAACRDEDRYGITPESDEEAAAAMLRTNDDMADTSTRPSQSAVVAQVSQGWPTQTQASTNEPEEIAYEGVSCCGFFFGHRRRSNSHQP